MKRVYKCKEEPEGLKRYRTNYPWESWEHFRPVSYTHLTLPTILLV